MLVSLILILLGVVILYFGAEILIKGSASFALKMGIAPIVVGLVIVGFGTSMPELIVSLNAVLANNGEIAMGNVVGSNICNFGLILGLSAMVRPIFIQRHLVRYDTPIMITASILLVVFLIDGDLSRWKGAVFLVGLVIYVIWAIRFDREHQDEKLVVELKEDIPAPTKSIYFDWLFMVGGLVGLWIGSKVFLFGATSIAQSLGISDAVIGLSLVALGTSLPELSTSIVAMVKNHGDLAIGNLIGSNIFNTLGIVGFTSFVMPYHVEGINWVDYSVMLAYAIVLLPFMANDGLVSRREGTLLFLGYFVYMGYLYLFQTPLGI